LPTYRVRFRRFDIRGKEGECLTASRTIVLATKLRRDPERLRQVLLHEMCHIGARYHGRRFQTKLAKLAAAGETWAARERDLFRERPRGSLTAEIAEAIEDGALDIPETPWSPGVLRELAERMRRSPQDILRAAPWAPRKWERSRLEALRLREAMPIGRGPQGRPSFPVKPTV
jgi:hypothetical protein